ncbi:MAG: hypothetical protein COU07_01655 [Candidatus Harrisonbacteria bacterium CG10_big_fil_rev_8_21_14_0_10_40_38]|uniref:SHS2 domain-containing protein n=1 Tax=Candidatus Harrisonbacteria bacterium CG10_big_fil_rev_8_21_14_0_10_40_38 TaxID=1974583 RepID=A0A2H0UT61_9BACT|nr:MAG: hypothetical protein COU07_01655 [Candidatus Harrisonbacteria bacterium CG10_big_fil_rev_8_21_14_0_10_40_38]
MSFLNSITGQRSLLGVDIGTTSIKVAEVGMQDKKLHLVNYGILETYSYLERFNEAFQTSSLKLSDNYIASHLKLLLSKMGDHTKSAVFSVPAFSVFSTLIEVPTASDSEIKKYIELQGKQYIPLPLETVTIDWVKVGEKSVSDGASKQQVLLISIPNENIEKYKNICRLTGLRLDSVEVDGMSLARSFGDSTPKSTLCIDIGGRSTSLSIVSKGFLKYSGQIDFSGGSITQAIANGLGISQRRAEDLKKQKGIGEGAAEHELSTIILPILDVIIYEAKKLVSNYETSYQEKVEGAFVTGGGSNLIGLPQYFTEHLEMPIVQANVFSNIAVPEILKSMSGGIGSLLGVSVGLSLKDLI